MRIPHLHPSLLSLLVFGVAHSIGFCNAAEHPSTAKNSPPQASNGATAATADAAELHAELAMAIAKMASTEISIAKSSAQADQTALRSSWFSLATVLGGTALGAVASLGAQVVLMRHQRSISLADAEAKIANSYVEWQLKQLSELYGPLRALLGQSNVLYRQMNQALVAADPNRFRLVSGDDFDKKEFEIFLAGEWVRFRTVKHLDEVYGKGYGVEPYFNDVVEVGERMANVIREKAGYARPDDIELVQVMGQYLAHYFVLKRLLDKMKAGEKLHSNAADEQATFPINIQMQVNDGFNNINREVMNWRRTKAVTS